MKYIYNENKPLVIQARVRETEFYREMRITEFLKLCKKGKFEIDSNTKRILISNYNQAIENMKIKLDF